MVATLGSGLPRLGGQAIHARSGRVDWADLDRRHLRWGADPYRGEVADPCHAGMLDRDRRSERKHVAAGGQRGFGTGVRVLDHDAPLGASSEPGGDQASRTTGFLATRVITPRL